MGDRQCGGGLGYYKSLKEKYKDFISLNLWMSLLTRYIPLLATDLKSWNVIAVSSYVIEETQTIGTSD